MKITLCNKVKINHYPTFKGNDLLELEFSYIYKHEGSSHEEKEKEILAELLLTKEAALELARTIDIKYPKLRGDGYPIKLREDMSD